MPDMEIETGQETARLLRERGWTHWHHLFSSRDLLLVHILRKHAALHPLYPAVCIARITIPAWLAGHSLNREETGVPRQFFQTRP